MSAARHAPATLRNRVPILDVLRAHLPARGLDQGSSSTSAIVRTGTGRSSRFARRGLVLEISAGTGEHAAFFAPALPHLTWQPTDPDPDQRASIAAWRVAGGEPPPNLLPPLDLDVEREPWPVAAADAIVNINMIHIAPWSACERLMEGAARRLPPGGLLYLYGPFMRDSRHTADSNARFDESLRAQDPRWGVRDLAAVEHAAAIHGLVRREIVPMPANNLSVIFRRDR